jgi:hypothetical protein
MSDQYEHILTASECAWSWIEDAETVLEATLKECGELSYERILLSFMSGVKPVLTDDGGIYYEVRDNVAEAISISATGTHEALAIAREICACNIYNGKEIPPPLRALCHNLVRDLPLGLKARKGPTPYQNFAQYYIAVTCVDYISLAYKLPKTRGDDGREDSAAHIVAEVFERKNVPCPYTRIRDWCDNPKHQDARRKAASITAKFHNDYLVSLGIVKPSKDWILGPYGQLWPIGRMTPDRIPHKY